MEDRYPLILRDFKCDLKKASLDSDNKVSMCDSSLPVVNLDKFPKEYARGKGWRVVPKSNDALYIDINGKWYLIEFKNGVLKKFDIYKKIYDSLIMLMDSKLIPDFDFVRKNMSYILVYNESKSGVIQKSDSLTKNYDYLTSLANAETRLFDIANLEGYLFNDTHTYTKELFETKFVAVKKKEENL